MAAMVGRIAAMAGPPIDARELAAVLLNEAKVHPDAGTRLERLKQLKDLVVNKEPALLPELLPYLLELRNEPASPVRLFLIDIIEEIGLRYVHHLPVMMPVLLTLLLDESPGFVRRTITAGTNLFRSAMEHVMLKGIYTGQADNYLHDAWHSVQPFKEAVMAIASQHGNDGVRLHAVKFVETVTLLYTPDPSGPPQPPPVPDASRGVNLAWIASGHPLLDAAALGQEAVKSLGLLLNLLRQPAISTLPGPVAIVVVNSLAAIAKRRPTFYGRILPLLLSLAPNCEAVRGAPSVVSTLKNAFLQLLKCKHAAAGPWRDRLMGALRTMDAADVAESALSQTLKSTEKELRSHRPKEDRDPRSKRPSSQENGSVGSDENYGKRLRATPPPSSVQPAQPVQPEGPQNPAFLNGTAGLSPVHRIIATFEALAAEGNAASIEMLLSQIPSDTLADVVIVTIQNLPPNPPPLDERPLPPPPAAPAAASASVDSGPGDVRRDPRRDPRRLDPRRSEVPGPPALQPKQEPLLAAASLASRSGRAETPPVNQRDPRRANAIVKPEPTLSQVKVEPDDDTVNLPSNSAGGLESFEDSVKPEPYSTVSAVITVLPLSEDQQSALGKAAFQRILEGHKPIVAAGGSSLRISLLARLTSQSNDTLDSIRRYILSDYSSHMGHELALHVLYDLYAENIIGGETLDIYDSFLLQLSQELKDNLPPSDKSLCRLLCEAPLLPEGLFKLLESFWRPDELSNDRITQGLTVLWSLILQRPSARDTCLKMSLECAVHEVDDVREKAIRLVANKLFPINSIAGKIEDFAKAMLISAVSASGDDVDTQERPKDTSGEAAASEGADDGGSKGTSEAQRCMSLYFALCTKKHALLEELFRVYGQAPKDVKQAIHQQIRVLIRTVKSSPDLLNIIADPPSNSENLLLKVLNTLTEPSSEPPSRELIATVKQLFETKLKDAIFLIPILPYLSKDEVLPVFPRLVESERTFETAVARILQGSPHTSPALTPAEVLIALHGLDPQRDSIPTKKLVAACSVCLNQRTVFRQDVLAKALNQLVEQTPLPLLFMRTVIQAVGNFPSLVDFVMDILSRLVSKQIWRVPQLWIGFLKCASETAPHSFPVLLQLPAAQLENALQKHPKLKAPLAVYAGQTNVRPSVPRSSQVILGLVQDETAASAAPAE